jgi:hypothetical protein
MLYVPRFYKKETRSVQLYTAVCEETTGERETEESPWLEAVAWERMVKREGRKMLFKGNT